MFLINNHNKEILVLAPLHKDSYVIQYAENSSSPNENDFIGPAYNDI